MTKSEKSSLLLVGLAGALLYMLQRARAKPIAQLPGDTWGGGLAGVAQIPNVIVDYFSGRSVNEVLANPGPRFQREVLDYRQEGQNYPAPKPAFIDYGQYL